MNKILVKGNLTRDPERRTTVSGVNLASFTVASNDNVGNEKTEYFKVTAWRDLGDTCAKYLKKGSGVLVFGTISSRAYKDANGDPKSSLELNAKEVVFLDKLDKDEKKEPAADNYGFSDINLDDIPFN